MSQFADIIALISALAPIEGRAAAAERLAQALGAQAMLLLILDAETDAMLTVLGVRKTLPGGPQWREFLRRCREPGLHRAELPGWSGDEAVSALACAGDGIAALFMGGTVTDPDAELMRAALPLLDLGFRAQRDRRIVSGELEAARYELRQSAALMKALDDARRQVDRALTELDAQARTLEEARERAEDAGRAKDQFMAMLGHELRNPLAPMVTALDLLQRRGVWSTEHAIMERQVGHVRRLVEDLLDVSRIASGKLTLKREPLDLRLVITRAIETVQPAFDQREQLLDFDLAPATLGVSGEFSRLLQVFINLLTNASKYSDRDTRVRVLAHRVGDNVVVEVADEGIGIAPEMLEGVFTLFEQVGRGIDRAEGGMGLGLAIVRSLVALHGGRVSASSAGIGHGSRFVVELPYVAMSEVAIDANDSTPVAEPSSSSERELVLLVDDNADALFTMTLALELVGFKVVTAGDGEAALRCASDEAPAVALLDIGLPGMDGYELARRLRQQLGTSIRMVALTGYGQHSDRARSREAGFDAHLVKPVDFPELQATLERLLH